MKTAETFKPTIDPIEKLATILAGQFDMNLSNGRDGYTSKPSRHLHAYKVNGQYTVFSGNSVIARVMDGKYRLFDTCSDAKHQKTLMLIVRALGVLTSWQMPRI